MLNHCEVMGRLTADPELRATQSGTPVVSFTLASDTGRKREDNSRITDFIDCVAWRQQAEFVAKYLTKGRLIVVEGKLTPRTYEDRNGAKHKVTEVHADTIHFADSRRDSDAGNNTGGDYAAPPSSGGFSELGDADDNDLPF